MFCNVCTTAVAVIARGSHNPCFSGQCFAINELIVVESIDEAVTILVLVDSVLQYKDFKNLLVFLNVTILVLVDSVLQYHENKRIMISEESHNPCFSGQCFAIHHD